MADDLLFVYSSPGPVALGEFTDWYDNEHVPARLALDGFGAVARFRAADGLSPSWLATYYIPMLLAVPGWRRSRRYRLASGDGPTYLSLHEIDSLAAFDSAEYKAAVSTPWRERIVGSAIGREKRVFSLHRSFA